MTAKPTAAERERARTLEIIDREAGRGSDTWKAALGYVRTRITSMAVQSDEPGKAASWL